MHCKTCAFYNTQGSECRRYAPSPAENEKKASWPNVAASDWCGEYREDADKAKKTA
jgi:hypothetical protein